MVTKDEMAKINGKDMVTFLRLFEERKTKAASLIPYQTGMTFGFSRDGDSTATKDGAIAAAGTLEVDWSVDFINNTAEISDKILEATLKGKKVEAWKINRARRNASGMCEAWYGQGTISEDSGDNDADADATRSITLAINGEPKHGWVKLPDETEELIDYVMHGLGAVQEADDESKVSSDAAEWKDADAGVNASTAASPASTKAK